MWLVYSGNNFLPLGYFLRFDKLFDCHIFLKRKVLDCTLEEKDPKEDSLVIFLVLKDYGKLQA